MELIGDWRALIPVVSSSATVDDPMMDRSPIFIVTEKDRVLAAYAPGMDLGTFIGGPLESLSERFRHRNILAYSRADMDSWMGESVAMNHYFDQVDSIRKHAGFIATEGPALLNGLTRLSSKFLPASFGVWLKIEGMGLPTSKGEPQAHEVLLVYRTGKLYSYVDTSKIDDTGGSIEERHRKLSGRYLIPLQTMVFTQAEFRALQASERPFRRLFLASFKNRIQMYPKRPFVMIYLAIKALFGG